MLDILGSGPSLNRGKALREESLGAFLCLRSIEEEEEGGFIAARVTGIYDPRI